MKKVLSGLAALPLVLIAFTVFAEINIPGRTDRWVNDYAGVIDENTKIYLEKIASSIKQKTPEPVEVIVTTFKSLGEREFEDFSREYGEKWRLAKRGRRDNGVIILVIIDDRRVAIGVGKNLEGILTQRVTNDIIQDTILPYFREGNYSEGIKKAAEAIIAILDKAEIPTGNNTLIVLGAATLAGLIIVTLFLLRKR